MTFDVAIIGGGPAGQAAAEITAGVGLSTVVVDEQARPGGQILRQPPNAFSVPDWLPGKVYRGLKAQLTRFEALGGVTWLGRHSALGAFRRGEHFQLWLSSPAGRVEIQARRLLVAAGCFDMPVPVPGWTTPGVMSAGGVQAFIKSQQIVPGEHFVLAGTHPLQMLVAAQIVEAGGSVAAVLFGQRRRDIFKAFIEAPLVAARHARTIWPGAAAYSRLQRSGIPVLFGARIEAIEGEDRVTGVRWSGGPDMLACDRVALCFGFLPQSDLVRAIGASGGPPSSTGGWAAWHDDWMRTDVPGLYVAGETAGVAGAEVALREGRLAGWGIAADAGAITPRQGVRAAGKIRRGRDRLRRFAALLDSIAAPGGFTGGPLHDDTIVCRCEDVTYGALREAVSGSITPTSANSLKLLTRAGMGLCQGRGCEHSVMRMLTELGRASPATNSGYTARFPARPVAIADLLA